MKKKEKTLNSKKKVLNEGQIDNSGHDVKTLEERLLEENKFLTMLVDTIPAKMYFNQEIREKITTEKHLLMNKAVKGIKRKSAHSSKSKHKRARLDPLLHKSVSEIHEELNQAKSNKGMLNQPASFVRAAHIEELQKRLQDRINEFKGKRKSGTSSDALEKKRLKNKMNKLNKKKKKNIKPLAVKDHTDQIKPKKVKKAVPPPVYNKDGKIIYSKFDFSHNGETEVKKSEYKGKSTKKLLQMAEKEKEKIDNLKVTDAEKAETLVKKLAWKKAIQKSEGIKVRDDPVLLKKSIKREEKIKSNKAKMWKKRTEVEEKRMQFKQDKRTKNIKARKKEKLEHKIKHAKKKGRVIPGF